MSSCCCHHRESAASAVESGSTGAVKTPAGHSRSAPTDRRELWLSVTAEFEKTLAEKTEDASAIERREVSVAGNTAGIQLPHRVARFFQWFIPTALLAVMPKCPMCLAAYLALFTGTGISFTAASHLRTGLIGVCVCTLLFLLVRLIRRNLLPPSSRTA